MNAQTHSQKARNLIHGDRFDFAGETVEITSPRVKNDGEFVDFQARFPNGSTGNISLPVDLDVDVEIINF